MKLERLAIVTNIQESAVRGGAETLFERLTETFRKYVPEVQVFPIINSEATFQDILESYVTYYDLDLSGYDGVVTTKAPTYAISHQNHVCYLVHTVRVFYDMYGEVEQQEDIDSKRKLIRRLDNELLRPPRVKRLFSIGYEVNKRLESFNNISSTVIHPGLPAGEYRSGEYNYIFMPGRLHRWKRIDLMIKAMKHIKAPVKLKISGTGEQEAEYRALAGDDERIEFLGYVTDDQMKQLYADALVVPFVPIREDYGIVLHEAFRSKKPVITCNDSGEPAYFVQHGKNGFLTEPDPKEIAESVEMLYADKELAAQMGQYGFESTLHITWENVVETLLEALESEGEKH